MTVRSLQCGFYVSLPFIDQKIAVPAPERISPAVVPPQNTPQILPPVDQKMTAPNPSRYGAAVLPHRTIVKNFDRPEQQQGERK